MLKIIKNINNTKGYMNPYQYTNKSQVTETVQSLPGNISRDVVLSIKSLMRYRGQARLDEVVSMLTYGIFSEVKKYPNIRNWQLHIPRTKLCFLVRALAYYGFLDGWHLNPGRTGGFTDQPVRNCHVHRANSVLEHLQQDLLNQQAAA